MGKILVLVSILCSVSFASPTVTFSGTPVTLQSQQVYPDVKVSYQGVDHALTLTGYGIYKRKISVFVENIYVAASYLVSTDGLKDDPMATVSSNAVRVLKLSILRSLTDEQIRSHIEDGLIANSVDLDDPAIVTLLDGIDFGLRKNEAAVFVGFGGAAQEVFVQVPSKELVSQSAQVADDIWSIWFKTPMDSGISTLKNKLIGN